MKKIAKQFFDSGMGYVPFKVLEGVFGIISLSLYSYLLSTKDYGNYGLVNTTVMLVYLLSFGWIFFGTMRYVQEQKNQEELSQFYTTILSLQGWILGSISLIYLFIGTLFVFKVDYDGLSLFLYFLFFLGYLMNQFYIGLLLYIRKRTLNVLLMVMASALKPLLVFVFYKMGMGTQHIIFLGHGIGDLLLGSIAFFSTGAKGYFDSKKISKVAYKDFFLLGSRSLA